MKYLITSLILALTLSAFTQREMEMLNPLDSLTNQQKATLAIQEQQFLNAARPAVTEASKSTVIISYRGTRLSYGTVVKYPLTGQNVILTKWSEIANVRHNLIVTKPNGKYNRTAVIGIYPEYDIAVLDTDATLTPLNLNKAATPHLGDFIVLANPSGRVQSLGVVSVNARSLRETDKAYLGVLMDFSNSNHMGIPLGQVIAQSPADHAGLRPGDLVVAVDNKAIKGSMEMSNILQKLVPGSNVLVRYRRGNQTRTTNVILGSRPRELDASRVPKKRLDQMQRMGAVPNQIRTDFPSVIQSDMPIQPNDTPDDPRDDFTNECGGPVVDLDGNVVGLLIARGSRIKTFIIPTFTLQQLLRTQPAHLQRTRPRAQTARHTPPRAIPVDE